MWAGTIVYSIGALATAWFIGSLVYGNVKRKRGNLDAIDDVSAIVSGIVAGALWPVSIPLFAFVAFVAATIGRVK